MIPAGATTAKLNVAGATTAKLSVAEPAQIVVVVDDSTSAVALMVQMLKTLAHCKPVGFTNSREALTWCLENEIDLVVVDYEMPAPNGIAFIGTFREDSRKASVPVVMVTSTGDRDVRYMALQMGATDFLAKPIDRIEFVARIRNLLDSFKAHKALAEAEKLAALGALVAGVAHEINTPIGVAVSAASTMTDRTDRFLKEIEDGTLRRSSLDTFAVTLRETADLLQRNLFRASELITNFKQVAVDWTSCQRREFDLREVTKETLMALNPLIRKAPVMVDTDIPSGIVMDGYPGPLGQIVTNFVTNAIMHAFEGRENGRIELVAQSSEGKVILQCRDDGIGMPPEILRRVFDPFFTTKLGKGGSGLGLHIVHTLITGLMGGEIGIESRQGEGTVITVTLPLTAPKALAGESCLPPAKGTRSRK